jgi:hypothetical protein
MSENGILYFHQEWTDVLNCLSLITLFQKQYMHLYVINRPCTDNLFKFYCRFYKNVILVPEELVDTLISFVKADYNFIGYGDCKRKDKYKDAFMKKRLTTSDLIRWNFCRDFYETYDIPYSVRINMFEITRDPLLESKFYEKIIKEKPYILAHTLGVREKLITVNHTLPIYELGLTTSIFFDAIRVLEEATEIHLIDSVWSLVCYLLDNKYKLFQHIQITVYCVRGYAFFFDDPPENWKIIKPENTIRGHI